MTNREWILNKMQNMSDVELAGIFYVTDFIPNFCEQDCTGRICNKCKTSWLKEKHKEKIKLSEAERVILENIDKRYKWIARDENNLLFVYETKPTKELGEWWGNGTRMLNVDIFSHLFQFMNLEDDEPYNIEELLK